VSPQMRRLMKIFGPGRDFPSNGAAARAAAVREG
jgi:hypothetical protein